jgi:hypothetical protein
LKGVVPAFSVGAGARAQILGPGETAALGPVRLNHFVLIVVFFAGFDHLFVFSQTQREWGASIFRSVRNSMAPAGV